MHCNQNNQEIALMDTTLRDGDQAAGVAFRRKEKEIIARALADIGVQEIEVGIPAMGPEEVESVKALVKLNLPLRVSTWNRSVISDLEASLRSGVNAVAISMPASDQQIARKLCQSREWALEKLGQAIRWAKDRGLYVTVGLEDASRADFEHLIAIGREAERLKADRMRFADTLGILEPIGTYKIFSQLSKALTIPLEIHGHNDLGMATANSVAAIQGGARAASVTLCGLGERTGNAPLEEVAIALAQSCQIDCGINFEKLPSLCRLVSKITGRPIAYHKPVIGRYAFTHSSSIHVDGFQKDRANYESYPPEKVGRRHRIALGKYSGRKALETFLAEQGKSLPEKELNALLEQVRRMSEILKRPLRRSDILALLPRAEEKCSISMESSNLN
ncbi:homocitrate synthase [Heliorestis convoluta]|uniref:Homocitrate synthase n=1 Tax=Heliorestis convoluta TaxID=356322 RepID=A0A5Q2N3U9_9FIRM|nr:homocitrate synthase [Heliorestis convoluta]QGG48559.1 homocitrate synthase [Heliorestis convoluta]